MSNKKNIDKKISCNYSNNYNPFHMVHTVTGNIKLKKKMFDYNIKLNSNLLNIKKYKSLQFSVCSKSKPKKNKDKKFLL